MKKQYQNVGASLVNLQKNKKVLVDTINHKCFGEKTYLDLVTPYTDLIALGRNEKGKHIYPPEVDFGEYMEFNKIDHAICNYLHVLIGCFEKMIKNFLMHVYCRKMKEEGDKQTKDFSWVDRYCHGGRVFDLLRINEVFVQGAIAEADKDTKARRRKVLKLISAMGTTQTRNNMVHHWQEKHHYVPMFIAIHALSLGQLLTMVGMLNQNDKNELLCTFNGTPEKRYSDAAIEKFEKDARRILVMRNIVNHYEPIFPLIQNTEYYAFGSFTDLLEKLKNYYLRSVSFAAYEFKAVKNSRARNNYSLEFHKKIERVIKALS